MKFISLFIHFVRCQGKKFRFRGTNAERHLRNDEFCRDVSAAARKQERERQTERGRERGRERERRRYRVVVRGTYKTKTRIKSCVGDFKTRPETLGNIIFRGLRLIINNFEEEAIEGKVVDFGVVLGTSRLF